MREISRGLYSLSVASHSVILSDADPDPTGSVSSLTTTLWFKLLVDLPADLTAIWVSYQVTWICISIF